jgi:1-acyl-sn-glycerol-3-phosphate acyltransferase
MKNISKFLKQLSLVYFITLGCLIFLFVFPLFLLFSFAALFYPRAKDAYYFLLLFAAKFYILISPFKYNKQDFNTISSLSHQRYIIVSNHRSHLDMLLLLANVFNLRAVANASLFRIPIFGQFMKLSRHFPMERGNMETYQQTLQDIRLALKAFNLVLFFPEMTRCKPRSQGIQKFRLTAFQLARENNIKIIPVVIHGTDLVWPKGEMEIDFQYSASITSLKAIEPNQFSTSEDLSQYVHKLMENKLLELSS